MKIRLSELKRLIKQTIKEATVLDLSNDRQFQTKVPSYHTKSSSVPEGDPCECLECGLEFSCDSSEDEMSCCTSSNQKCLRNVLDLVAKNPKLQIMVGPSDRSYDTRHFWAVDSSGKVHDPTRNDYDSYAYGKPFDMKANADFVSSMLEKKAELAEDGEHKLQGHG